MDAELLAYGMEGMAFLLLLVVGWWQVNGYRIKSRNARREALAKGGIVLCGDRSSCDIGAQALAEYGIRSWRHRQLDQWVLVVDPTNRLDAERLLKRPARAA